MIGKHATSMADKLRPFSGDRFSYVLCRLMGELRR